MVKNTDQINVKLDSDTRAAVIELANLHGMSASEFIRSLIVANLKEKLDELSVLQAWATSTGNLGNENNGQ